MKKFLFAAFPIAAVALMTLNHSVEPLPIGATIPNADLKMKNIDGSEVSFKEANNKNGLLVMFSCNTCPVVFKYQTRSNEVCKYAMEKEIGVVLLNSNEAYRTNGDSYNDMIEYAKKNSYTWKYVLDNNSSMADAFGANRTPECFLFDKDLKLIYHGAIDDNSSGPDEVTRKHLMIAIDEMLSGKEVSMKETRSVGCTIKRKS